MAIANIQVRELVKDKGLYMADRYAQRLAEFGEGIREAMNAV
jgi:hypothetical protein